MDSSRPDTLQGTVMAHSAPRISAGREAGQLSARLAVLLLALCLAAGAVYFVATAGRKAGPGGGDWSRPNPGDVRQVTVRNEAGAFTLVRSGREWFMDMPDGSRLRAEEQKVGGLVRFVGLSRPLQRLGAASADLAHKAGLAQPGAEISLDGLDLRLGGSVPDKSGVYALSNRGRELLVLHPEYTEWLRRGPEFYLDARILPGAEVDATAVRLTRDGVPVWEVRRRGDGYEFDLPAERQGARVSSHELGLYLHGVASTRALSLPAEAPDKQASSLLELTVWSASSREPQHLALYPRPAGPAEAPRYVGVSTWQPVAFTLDQERVALLAASPFALSDRRLLHLDLGRVGLAVLRQDGREIVARHTPEGWTAGGTGTLVTGLDMYLWRLTDLTYLEEPRADLPAAAAPKLSLALADDKGAPLAALTFFVSPDLPKGRCLVQVGGEGPYYPADDQVLKDLAGQLPTLEGNGRRQSDAAREAGNATKE
jgi:hypothetical protein